VHYQARGLQELHRLGHQVLQRKEGVWNRLAEMFSRVVRQEIPADRVNGDHARDLGRQEVVGGEVPRHQLRCELLHRHRSDTVYDLDYPRAQFVKGWETAGLLPIPIRAIVSPVE
jgi:hypothetical protein